MGIDTARDIRDRTFQFACRTGRIALGLASAPGARSVAEQLLSSGTGVGANLEEAKAASSRREFLRYIEIALREARETVYWLRLCRALNLGPSNELEALQYEGEQVVRIIGAIAVRTKISSP
jgi:four helix bundle protein